MSGAAIAGPKAMAMAGVTPADIDVRAIYDCYTYTTLITLEDYGFCAKGEGGELAASGALGPGGDLPTNTGGGQLSSFYLWGMTPLSEAVIQVRGQGGERQVDAPRRGHRQRQRRRPRLPQHARRRDAAAMSEPVTEFHIERDEASAPFFDAARDGRLRDPPLRRRVATSSRRTRRAARTAATLEWVDAAGTATLVTWSVDHGAGISPELTSATGDGEVIAIVELAEGPWLHTAVPGVDPAALAAGMPMRVEFLAARRRRAGADVRARLTARPAIRAAGRGTIPDLGGIRLRARSRPRTARSPGLRARP